jgi:hypothetical protein
MSHVTKPAEFSLTPSRYTLFAKLSLAMAAGLLIALLPILLMVKIVSLLILLVAAYRFYRNYCEQKPERLFVVDSDADCWRLISPLRIKQKGMGKAIDLQLEPSQFVTAHLVILYFRSLQGARFVRVIPRDSLSAEEHRLLRKLLLSRTSCD